MRRCASGRFGCSRRNSSKAWPDSGCTASQSCWRGAQSGAKPSMVSARLSARGKASVGPMALSRSSVVGCSKATALKAAIRANELKIISTARRRRTRLAHGCNQLQSSYEEALQRRELTEREAPIEWALATVLKPCLFPYEPPRGSQLGYQDLSRARHRHRCGPERYLLFSQRLSGDLPIHADDRLRLQRQSRDRGTTGGART